MRFEHPHFLWALFLLAIPIVIHLFNFRRYKVFYFSSLQFLKNIEEETRSVRKLKHLFVLISRLLAFIFLILAFAQPYIPVKEISSSQDKKVLAIYIDNSFSMTCVGSDGNLLSESKEQARKFIENAPASTEIMLVSNELTGIEQQICTKSEALVRLDKISFSPLTKKLSEIVHWITESLKENTIENTTKQFVVLSDFQKTQSDIANIVLDKSYYFYPIQVRSQQKQNISIDSIWFNEPNFKIKINNELNIQLSNHGNEDVRNLELQFTVNETKRTVFVEIAKNSTKTIEINYSDLTTGEKIGQVHINDKNMYFDDDYYFTYTVRPSSNILIIQGENASPYISKTYRLDNYYHIEEVSSTSFLPEFLKNKQLIVLNGVNKLNDGINDALVKFTKTGGSMLLFPGNELALQPWNKLLFSVGLPRITGVEQGKLSLTNINYEAPYFKGVFDAKPAKISIPMVKKLYATTSNYQSTALLTLQKNKTLFTKSGSNYLFCSSLDSTFSSFTSNALFPSCLLRTAELSQQKSPLNLILGTDIRYPIYETSKSENTYHVKGESVDFIPNIEKIDQQTYLSLVGTDAANRIKQGIYTIENNENKNSIAINYGRIESSLDCYTEAEIKGVFTESKFPNLHFKSTELGNSNLQIELEKPTEYWRFFLLLSLVFLLTEMALLKFLR